MATWISDAANDVASKLATNTDPISVVTDRPTVPSVLVLDPDDNPIYEAVTSFTTSGQLPWNSSVITSSGFPTLDQINRLDASSSSITLTLSTVTGGASLSQHNHRVAVRIVASAHPVNITVADPNKMEIAGDVSNLVSLAGKGYYEFVYDSTAVSGAGAWRCIAANTLTEAFSTRRSYDVSLMTPVDLPTYTAGSGVLTATTSGILMVDDVAVSSGDLILVLWSDPGIYQVTQAGDETHPWVLTLQHGSEETANDSLAEVRVLQGTVGAKRVFYGNDDETGWIEQPSALRLLEISGSQDIYPGRLWMLDVVSATLTPDLRTEIVDVMPDTRLAVKAKGVGVTVTISVDLGSSVEGLDGSVSTSTTLVDNQTATWVYQSTGEGGYDLRLESSNVAGVV